MLLALAASTQVLLIGELLLRRLLYLFVPTRRAAVQRYADNSVLSSLAAACLQTATLPLQAAGSLVGSLSRFSGLLLVAMLAFAALMVLSNSSVYAYRVLAQMYNTGVAPVVGSLKWLFVLLDFGFRVAVPLWNGLTYLGSQILQRVIVPYSFTNVEVLPELLQALVLCATSLAQSVLSWLEHVRGCTVSYVDQARVCGISTGISNGTLSADCSSVFTHLNLRCYATPNHLSLDVLTPGLFARQAALALQRAVGNSCGVAALVLNLLLFPLCDHNLYSAAHAGVNLVLFSAVGVPVSTWRRCRALDAVPGLLAVHRTVGCTPDWQPVGALAESALARAGDVVDNWLNAAAVLIWQEISAQAPTCERPTPMAEVVLDAARAVEGLESVDALVRLQGRDGLPHGETLQRVRVVGLTSHLFGVSDGKSVLYRSPHDGYVLAFGAWPFAVDVRLGLAAVSYGGSSSEADTAGDARTGLLGCRCVDGPELALWCATAPYVQHVDDELAGLNASSVHKVSFPDLVLAGLTCANTEIRVMPLRWPRRRLATTQGNGGSGFAGYTRFSYLDIAARLKGDQDATDNLRVLSRRHRAVPSGAVEAAIYVQPVCGGDAAVSCAPTEPRNCYPWCMGVVRGGRRAQNISMYNMRRWEEHVILPDVDCVVRRDSACAQAEAKPASFIDVMAQAGVVQGRCHAENMCTPHPVPAAVMSLVPLDAIAAAGSTMADLVRRHKQDLWLGVRTETQPFVVAGDVMLALAEAGGNEVVVVTRLYDIGQSTLQVASERLTLTSNAHAVAVATCPTQDSTLCVAQHMQAGRLVLPAAVREVRSSGVAEAGLLPHATASRWAVHWAENPEVSVYNAFFEYCHNNSAFAFMQLSSYSRARVWTLQTMRSVDMEAEGEPSAEEQRSRVSYMRVPFFLDHTQASEKACDRVVGLRIEGVEFLNEQNVLVTVAAARPRDYDPRTGAIAGPRTHRYYYLHPGRHDCVRTEDEDALDGDPAIFSCWRAESRGMWPADELLADGPLTSSKHAACPGALQLPAFGSALVMPLITLVHVLETVLDAMCTLPALLAANPRDPVLAMEQLFTLELRQSSFHGMVDSAGGRLFQVDEIVAASRWLSTFAAHLMVYVVNGLAAASQGAQLPAAADKQVQGLRTLVVGGAKVYEGMPRADGPLQAVEQMFREPAAYAGHSASMAVLSMADNLQNGNAMNPLVGMFIKAQLSLVSTLEITLRLGRVLLVRLVQTIGAAARGSEASATSIVSAAVLESRAIVEDDWLDQMRFQCYGLAQMLGAKYAWGQAVRNLCLLAPDTLQGAMTVGTVLVLEYPMVACACKLGEGEPLGRVSEICLRRPLPVESTLWLQQLSLATASQQEVCFAAMDSANARLQSAFDKSYRRLYELTRHVAQVVDGLLALVTGDTVACDAFDVSPYVLSIIPEPVDYFSSCVDTEDCEARCLEEFDAFAQAKRELQAYKPGFVSTLTVPLESMLFSPDDIEQGLNKPPFLVLDAVELPRAACIEVCNRRGSDDRRSRCLVAAGLRGAPAPLELAVAYYCLPLDVSQYAYQWPDMPVSAQPAAGAPMGYAALQGSLRALLVATSWGPEFVQRDSLIALVETDESPAATAANERVSRVLWFVPGLAPRELLRTSLRVERQLLLEEPAVLNKGYLHQIEHVQVDVADTSTGSVILRVFGFRMQKAVLPDSDPPVYTWSLPTRACVECLFLGDPRDFDGVQCGLCALREGEDVQQMSVFAQSHVRVCLKELGAGAAVDNSGCAEMLALPTSSGTAERLAQDNLQPKEPEVLARVVSGGLPLSRTLRAPPSTLNVFRSYGAYMDMQQQVHARSVLVARVVYLEPAELAKLRSAVEADSADMDVALEVFVANAGSVDGAWMQVLALRLRAEGVGAAARDWLQAETTARLITDCSIQNCGACAWSDGAERPALRELENLCYAAQQCGVERCAGTLVNMRKPLCNLGNVLASEMHAIRVLLKGLWGAVADSIVMVVELTHERRQEYQIKWPELLVRKQACTAKDAIVSTAASITSIFGAFSHLMQDVSVHNGFVGSSVDSRVHARYIMMLTATTNMLSSVMLWPVYQGLVLQKFFACTANDVSYTIENLIAGPGAAQRTMTIRFGDSRKHEAIERAQIAVCLSEDVRQSLQDAGVRAAAPAAQRPASTFSRDATAVTKRISEAISNSVDLSLGTFVQYSTHVLDVWLTWAASVIKGLMDVAQTIDWQNCKLPVVDTGLQSLGLCACGDQPYAIPPAEKKKRWTEQAFWCSGLLLLNEGDGSDQLVWNPFSLEELLSMHGAGGSAPRATLAVADAGPSQGSYDEYVRCLRGRWDSASEYHQQSCEAWKPTHVRLRQQGVEIMQVVSRCRSNYQQKRWDEAAVLYSLFTVAEWTNLDELGASASAGRDDAYTLMRRQIVRLLDNDRDMRPERGLALPQATWDCLRDAADAGVLQHRCHGAVSAFEYQALGAQVLPSLADACKVLSPDAIALQFPRLLWSGSSSNHAPLANPHAELLPAEERRRRAELALQRMMDTEIRPAFEELMGTSFYEELKGHLRTEAFSVEGDELHQLIDCVVLGPYSSADLSSNIHLDGVEPLPVPQYHRGRADSREFTSWGPTGGSQARQDLLRTVFALVNEQAEDITVAATQKHLTELAAVWLDPENFRCRCADGARGWSCCAAGDAADFALRDTTLSQQDWEIQNTVMQTTYQRVVDSKILREALWTTHMGSEIPLSPAQRAELHAAQVFEVRDAVPVRTYSVADTAPALNTHSLWETCTSRVTGLFSTMPFKPAQANAGQGRAPDESVADVREGLVEGYDPAADFDPGRMHSIEMLVDGLLERARATAPHFWTHANRYVPSDSVWCEAAAPGARTTPPVTQTPRALGSHQLRSVPLDAPDQADLLYPAGVLKSCACGWWRDGCFVPKVVCARAKSVSDASDAATRELWARLCEGGTYDAPGDLLLVLGVLRALPPEALADASCSARRPSLAWGLLSPAQQEAWYAGEPGIWSFDAQHLATAGPAGLRLGMLSPWAAETLAEYVQHFDLGEGLRDTFNARYGHTIGQPVCEGTLRAHLADDLREYFVDTLVPMAHAVQIVPAVEYCSRWVLEYAMLAVLRRAAQDPETTLAETLAETLARQEAAADLWRRRCVVQMHEVGLCALRGVYDIVPDAGAGGARPPAACPFAGSAHEVSGCSRLYYTSSCLLYCDGSFYDPCLCDSGAACAPRPFTPAACAGGLVVDGRQLLGASADEVLLTSSLRWPSDIAPAEAANDTHWERLRAGLQEARAVSKVEDVDLESLFAHAKAALLQRPDEEDTPHAYCDDLFDYWPDTQHPVGFHPTTACSAQDTNTRGFDAWMSRDSAGTTLLDPVRMRNMTQASRAFGASHLVCDAHVYAAPGHALNPYYMQSKWKRESEADPAVPVNAPPVELGEMSVLGSPSFDDTDTSLRTQGHPADALLQHSVGLVRAWARWFADNSSEAAAAQALLDTAWPHWLPDEVSEANAALQNAGLFLSRAEDPPAGCAFPRLLRCRSSLDCKQHAVELVCLLNFHEEENSRRGVCMRNGTCYQHEHCPPDQLCSGEGTCVAPKIFVRNEARWDAEVQLFGREACDTSMRRTSRFESVADFATANGMCSFRNWYHYLNATTGAKRYNRMRDVKDKEVFRTDEAEPRTLQELGVLKTLAHGCDRSYAHTDFLACTAITARVSKAGAETPATVVSAAQTWQAENGTWHARFCDMPGGTVSGFLDPYKNVNTLKNARRDIRRCIEFNLCPATKFHVRGRAVESRRVQIQVAGEDSAYGVRRLDAARDYCSLDAQRCWGAGYLLGRDCRQVDLEESALCVVDPLVLPLLSIVYARADSRQFPTSRAEFEERLRQLRETCPLAFRDGLKSEESQLNFFIDVHEHLTRPYAWTDAERRGRVTEYANRLLWLVFGEARGFADLEAYLDHAQCAVFLARRLSEEERGFGEEESFKYYPSSSPEQVLPGSSLYLIDRRFPVNVNLQWCMQCVVLAANTQEGGVSADFFNRLHRGVLSQQQQTEQCANYQFAPQTATLPLRSWLSKAPFLFTQTRHAEAINPLQFKQDIYTSVSKALSDLGVFDMPDLLCVSTDAEGGWAAAFVDDALVLPQKRASTQLHRFRLPGLNFALGQESTGVAVTQQIFGASGNVDIYQHVFDFLLEGTASASWDWDADDTVTFDELLEAGVLKEVLKDVNQEVPLTDRYTKYKYVNLETKLPSFASKFTETVSEREYFDDSLRSTCGCSKAEQASLAGELCTTRRRLRTPEFSRQGTGKNVKCQDLKLLPCTAPRAKDLIDLRMGLNPPFLSQAELLYLVLLIFEYEISYTATGGFTPLHRVLDPAQAQFVRDMYEVPLPGGASALHLHEAAAFNRFLDRHDAISLKCQPQDFDYFQETNDMHVQMRLCKESLQKPIGWQVPAGGILALQPRRQTLHSGFHLSYMQRDAEKTFLEDLLQTSWHEPAHTSPEKAICLVAGESVRVMAPFWAEYFDVASSMGSEDGQDPALACDFERSSPASMLMVYDTLCATSSSSLDAQACAEHPNYQRHLSDTLPEECARKDGHAVVRRQLGALDDGHAPLCDRRPVLPAACALKHGALNGRLGSAVEDLDATHPVAATETGFWNPASSIFRGAEGLGLDGVRALAVHPHDIAGHCLEFRINAEGVLHLRSAFLASECDPERAGGEVQSWLADVEQEWAWDHAHSARLHVVEDAGAPSWTCPLHWLQQYHDDNTRYQARSPSWQRNVARFEHITLEHKYAHPTVRHANKVRGVRAARFLGDALGCVAAAEDCHARAYLDRTLETLLRPEDDWHMVAYVPESHPECSRVLDWPEDCGKARPDAQPGQHGQCHLRQ